MLSTGRERPESTDGSEPTEDIFTLLRQRRRTFAGSVGWREAAPDARGEKSMNEGRETPDPGLWALPALKR
jgi:hypothetical protein